MRKLFPVLVVGALAIADAWAQGNAGTQSGANSLYLQQGTGATPIAVVTGITGGAYSDQGYDTLQHACSGAAAAGKMLQITKNWLNLTGFSCTANVRFFPGGLVQPASGQFINFTATVTAPAIMVFDQSLGGTVSMTSLQPSLLAWWNGPVDGGVKQGPTSIQGNLTSTTVLTNVEYDNGTCTTAKTINPSNGNRQKVTLTNAQACALTFTQPASATVSVQLKIIQSSAGGFNGTITGGKWPGGTVATITATSGAVDIITCYLDGTNAYCVASQDFR